MASSPVRNAAHWSMSTRRRAYRSERKYAPSTPPTVWASAAAAVPGVHATEGTAKPPRMRSRRSPVDPFQRPLPFKPFIQSPWSAPPRIRGGLVFRCWLATRLCVSQQVAPEDGGQPTHTTHRVHSPPDELRTTVDPGKFEGAGGESRQPPGPPAGAPLHRPAAIGNHTQSAVPLRSRFAPECPRVPGGPPQVVHMGRFCVFKASLPPGKPAAHAAHDSASGEADPEHP